MSPPASRSSEPLSPEPPEVPDDLTRLEQPTEVRGVELDLRLLEGLDLSERDASATRISESRLAHLDLSGCSLKGASFRDVIVDEGSWANASAERVSLHRAHFERLRLTGVDLANAVIEDASFVDCRIDLASFRFATLERVCFQSCRMEEVDFYDARLTSVVFSDCSLIASTWAGATLTRSEMRGCDLAGAGNLERLRGVRMPWADIVNSAGELAAAVGIEIIDRG